MIIHQNKDITRCLPDATATAHLAASAAAIAQKGDILCLFGGLGAGKTTFARGFLQALGIKEEVPSPTFSLVLTYETHLGTAWHFDLFRITEPDETQELGIEDAFTAGICLIEWPERLGPWMPNDRIEFYLSDGKHGKGRQSRLRIIGKVPKAERWQSL